MSEVPDRPAPPRSLFDRAQSWVQWVGAGRIVAAAVVVVAVLAGGYWLVQPPPTTAESTLPYATSGGAAPTVVTVAAPSTTAAPNVLVVHVAGAVVSPGVRSLPAGSRVVDAITAAGGLASQANADALNLAAPLADGQRVYVPVVGEVVAALPDTATAPGTAPPAGPVNLNSASVQELETLPGVGPATAAAIVAHRDEHGPFLSVEGLADVAGIGPAKLEALRGLVTV